MEMANWTNLIMGWVNTTELVEKPCLFLDQTDLDLFYAEYRKLMIAVTIPERNIRDFIKAQYPAFQIHFFDDNTICSADYMYIYCLLLHYSCVVCKDKKFQSICMKLTGSQQESIASLFSRLGQREDITRASLKGILRETPVESSSIEFMKLGSPIRTPLKTSPPTPAVKLLEDRSRELISVKAQLETERYEKNFLEAQLKETEERLRRANQQQKHYVVEIKQLKEKLLYGDEQNIPQNGEKKSGQSLVCLQRQIQQLEDKICNLNADVEVLTQDKRTLQTKAVRMEEELSNFRKKCHEQVIIHEDVQAELQNKLLIIANLESVNEELTTLIKELKPSNDLNSTDSLDFSFGSSNSKIDEIQENLAKTVVEVQLREKENENQIIRTALAVKEAEMNEIAQEIKAFMLKIEADESVSSGKDIRCAVPELMNMVEKLMDKEAAMKKTLGKAEVEQSSLVDTIARLNDECARMKQEMDVLVGKERSAEETLSRAQEELVVQSQEMERIAKALKNLQCSADNAEREVFMLMSVNARYENIIEENEALEKELSNKIKKLEEKCSVAENQREDVKKSLEDHKRKLNESEDALREKQIDCERVEVEMEKLKKEHSVLTNKISDLSSIVKSLQEVKEHRNTEVSQLTEQLKSQKSEVEQLKHANESVLFEKDELRAELETKTNEIANLEEVKRICEEKVASFEKLLQESEEVREKEKITLEDQFKEAKNLVDDLKDQVGSFEAQEIELCKQINALTTELTMCKSDNKKCNSKKLELIKQLDMQKTQTLHLLNEIESGKREIVTLKDAIKEKDILLETTVAAKDEVGVNLQKSVGEFDEIKQKCSELESEKQAVVQELERLKAEVNQSREKMTKLSSDADVLMKLNEQLDELSAARSSDAIEKLKDVQEQMLLKDYVIENLENEKDKLNRELAEMKEVSMRNADQIKNMEKQIDEECKMKREIAKSQEEELSSLQRALAETYKKTEILSATVQDLESTKKELSALLEAEVAQKKEFQEKMCREREASSQLEDEIQSLKEDLTERKSHCTKIVAEVAELKKNVECLTTQLSEQQSENDLLREKNKCLSEGEAELQKKVEKLTNDIQDLDAIKKEVSMRMDNLVKEIGKKEVELENQKKESQAVEENLRREISEVKSQNCDLQDDKKSFEEKIANLANLEKNLAEIQDTLTAKESTIRSLEDVISSKTVEMVELSEKMEAIENKCENHVKELQNDKIALEEKSAELQRMEEDRKVVNEKAKQLLEKQQNFEIKCTQYEKRIKQLCESKTKAIDVLQREISGLEKRNIDLSDNLKTLQVEFDVRNDENLKLREEIQSIECQNDEITQKLLDSDGEIQNLQVEIKKLLSQNTQLEANMSQKDSELLSMKISMNKKSAELSTDSAKIANLLQEVEKYKGLEKQVKQLESLEHEEKEINERLVNENAILHAKLQKNRQILDEKEKSWVSERDALNKTIAECGNADEKVSEMKREMEGKLEKMKDKMKTLCTAELEKMKTRYEKKLVEKDQQVKSLSHQINSLNSEKLELVKENMHFKRKNDNAAMLKKPMLPELNFNMEDEEGEQFNNTYLLKDVKLENPEHASLFGRESVTKEELDYRNSKQPPHLKCQYAAQYGIGGNFEDDVTSIGDANGHDDSMSSLLYAGQRKKMSGTTSYKRPGPPTPSKNGGRLSLSGATEIHPRQILKEINESTKQQTPSGLRHFFGRRSLAKDENPLTSPAARFKSIFRNKRAHK
ncbi:interaptin [Phlebotomus argentipes]|uniref:interaptin n=1 Tax=Phlebotomus argentipes TaxID=94469 RepID=UPI002892BB48|nr:interaptin [Phlebotomus argentipes]